MSTEVGKIHYTLDLDDGKFKSGVDSASSRFSSLGSSMTNIGSTMTKAITLPIAGIGVASYKMAANLQDAMGATEQIFQGQAKSMMSWADSLPTYYGIAEGEALEYANTMGAMLQNIGGLTEEQAANQAQKLIEMAGDLTAMFGGSTQDAVRALTGSLKGNNTMLDNYGMAVNDAMIQTEALRLGILKKGETMTLAAKQAATLSLIEQQTGFAMGQAGREADGASGNLRTLITELKNLGTEIGTILLPIILPFLEKVVEWIQKFGELDTKTQTIIMVIAGVAAIIGPLLIVLGTLITSVVTVAGVISGPLLLVFGAVALIVGALIKHFGGFQGTIDAVRNAFQKVWSFVQPQLMPLFNIFKNLINELVTSLKKLWDQIAPLLIPVLKVVGAILGGIVVVAILAVIGALMVVIKTISFVANAWADNLARMKQAVTSIFSYITDKFNAMGNKLNEFKDKLNNINPFQRHSPSLVDNVKKGVSVIAKEYSNLFKNIEPISLSSRFNLADNMTGVQTGYVSPTLNVTVDNYYGDQVGLTNFTEKIMEEMNKIKISRGQ